MSTTLWQINFEIRPEAGESLSTLFEETAISSSWYELEFDGRWVFQAVFEKKPEESWLYSEVKKILLIPPEITITLLEEADWLSLHHQFCPPLQVGPFYIYDSYLENLNIPPATIPLEINANTAFGSGHHETTQGCLQAIAEVTHNKVITKPLDVGCGSGILALATAALLKMPVIAGDMDPIAVDMTKENAVLNKLDHLIHIYVSEGLTAPEIKSSSPYDLIIANILANPLCDMADELSAHLTLNGNLILSGLLVTQAETVINAYASHNCKLQKQLNLGNWSTLILEKIK